MKEIIEKNFRSTGLFNPLKKDAFVQKPDIAHLKPRFEDWALIKAQALITGKVTLIEGKLRVEFRLWDVLASKEMMALAFTTVPNNWRRVGHIITDKVYLNSGIVVKSHTPGDWEYTYHIAHEHGWMFGIPLRDRTGWGYLYNSNVTSQLEAQSSLIDILQEYQIEFHSKNCREFFFKNYYAKSIVNEDGNIFLNGNRALFLEPIQATSLGCFGVFNRLWFDGYEIVVFVTKKTIIFLNEVVG